MVSQTSMIAKAYLNFVVLSIFLFYKEEGDMSNICYVFKA